MYNLNVPVNVHEAMEFFGLDYGFTEEELKKAYRAKVRELHPDNFSVSSAEITEAMQYANDRRDTLASALKRLKEEPHSKRIMHGANIFTIVYA